MMAVVIIIVLVAVGLVGLLAVMGIAGIDTYLKTSKTAEATNNVGQMAKDAQEAYTAASTLIVSPGFAHTARWKRSPSAAMSVDGRFGPVARLPRRGRAFAPAAMGDGNACCGCRRRARSAARPVDPHGPTGHALESDALAACVRAGVSGTVTRRRHFHGCANGMRVR